MKHFINFGFKNTLKKQYYHFIQLFQVFGNELRTQRFKNKLADYALHLSLDCFSKKQYLKSLFYAFNSFYYNPQYIIKYLKNKLHLKRN